MNREIKFRAWDNEKQKMVDEEEYGYYDCYGTQEVKIINQILEDTEKEFVFMQYTGMKDKKGVEIYEGDIVQISGYSIQNYNIGDSEGYEYLIIGVVIYLPSKGFCLKRIKTLDTDNEVEIKSNNRYAYITQIASLVKGNKFENPKLLQL